MKTSLTQLHVNKAGSIASGKLQVHPQRSALASIAHAVTIVLVVMLILAVAACCVAFALEMFKLKSEIAAEQKQSLNTIADRMDSLNTSMIMLFQDYSVIDSSRMQQLNISFHEEVNDLQNQTQQFIANLNASMNMLFQAIDSRTQQLNISFHQEMDDLQNQAQQIIDSLARTGWFPTFPASSCGALPPSSPSGYYWVRALQWLCCACVL